VKTNTVAVTGLFDDVRSRDVRFLQEASRLGKVTVFLWSDRLSQELLEHVPKFPKAERRYFLQAVRFVSSVQMVDRHFDLNALPQPTGRKPDVWAIHASEMNAAKAAFCQSRGITLHPIGAEQLAGFPDENATASQTSTGRKKVIVTGCYDWFHSGHVRFFEEVSALGDLYVIVGHDENIQLLKGSGHPLLPQDERRYMAGSIRFVTQALISSGNGWLDAEPEIDRLHPDIYAVNEDGDKGGKRQFCEQRGIQYVVLKRTPAPGLPARSSTTLRGF
jgi:cytidyltransferase-like protein